MSTGAQRLLKLAGQIPVHTCLAQEWLVHLLCANPHRRLQLQTAA